MPGRALILCYALLCLLGLAADAGAAEIAVPAQAGALAKAIGEAQSGDTLRLLPGKHTGSFQIGKPLKLIGDGKAHVVGTGRGSVITVSSAGVVLQGLVISGSGSSAEHRDSAIVLQKGAEGALVKGNRLVGNLIGVDVHGSPNARVVGNEIIGRRGHRMNSRGNGVYVWNAPGAQIVGNDIRWGRDGIFVNTSRDNTFTGNRLRDLRFAIHYMYANNSTVADNVSIGNHLGYALMFSKNLTVRGNRSVGDRDYGIMLNYTNSSVVEGNLVEGAGDRCVFIYNAHKNQFQGNRFERCGIGVHFTAGSERNRFTGNAFIGNQTQVKYVGSRWLDWSVGGRGNYWSDHPGYDLDGDGTADSIFRPNDSMDHILWTQPAAKLLLGSPAVQLIRWSLSTFPSLNPGGVVDSRPLMRPVPQHFALWEVAQ